MQTTTKRTQNSTCKQRNAKEGRGVALAIHFLVHVGRRIYFEILTTQVPNPVEVTEYGGGRLDEEKSLGWLTFLQTGISGWQLGGELGSTTGGGTDALRLRRMTTTAAIKTRTSTAPLAAPAAMPATDD